MPHVDVKERKDSEANLNDDDFISRGVSFNPPNDTEVEDESSSLLLLGPPGTRVQFFQHGSFKGGEFDVQTGGPSDARGRPPNDYAPAVLVRDFNAAEVSVPTGKVVFVKAFQANDSLTSFKWAP